MVTSEADDKVVGEASDRITAVIGQHGGGQIDKVDRWGKRRFAYEVKLRVENTSSTPRTVSVMLPWRTRTEWKGVTEKFRPYALPGRQWLEWVKKRVGEKSASS